MRLTLGPIATRVFITQISNTLIWKKRFRAFDRVVLRCCTLSSLGYTAQNVSGWIFWFSWIWQKKFWQKSWGLKNREIWPKMPAMASSGLEKPWINSNNHNWPQKCLKRALMASNSLKRTYMASNGLKRPQMASTGLDWRLRKSCWIFKHYNMVKY